MEKNEEVKMTRQQRRFQERQQKKLNKHLQKEKNATTFNDYSKTEEEKQLIKQSQVNNTFGCEVSDDYLNINQKKILKKIGLANVLKVTRRKKGMTSSGIGGQCHGNVYKLVNLYGGQQLLGYALQTNSGYDGLRCFQVYWHSVWITPEGKLVDPTESVIKCDHTYFSPVVLYRNDNVWTQGLDMFFPEEYEEIKYILSGDDLHPDAVIPFFTLSWKTSIHSGDVGKTPEGLINQLSGFTKPSLFTGKSYSETEKFCNAA
jgi:hypothetical protein